MSSRLTIQDANHYAIEQPCTTTHGTVHWQHEISINDPKQHLAGPLKWKQTSWITSEQNYIKEGRWTDRQTDGQSYTDRHTSRQTNTDSHTQTDRQTDRQTYTDIHTDRQTDRKTQTVIHRHTYIQTDRQTDIHTDRHIQIDRHRQSYTDRPSDPEGSDQILEAKCFRSGQK